MFLFMIFLTRLCLLLLNFFLIQENSVEDIHFFRFLTLLAFKIFTEEKVNNFTFFSSLLIFQSPLLIEFMILQCIVHISYCNNILLTVVLFCLEVDIGISFVLICDHMNWFMCVLRKVLNSCRNIALKEVAIQYILLA